MGRAGARKRPGFVAELAAKLHPFLEALTETKDLGAAGALQRCNFEASKKRAAHNTFKSG